MRASFNGARRNLVAAFNRLLRAGITPEQIDACEDLRSSVCGLLCMYDPDNPNDCDDLVDEVEVLDVSDYQLRERSV